MPHSRYDGPSGPGADLPPPLTALVVDDSFAARARITTLLELGGWRVLQAVGTDDALRVAAMIDPDLVVTDMVMRNGHGATLLRRLREQGSRARFLVVAGRRTSQTLALASGAGALACLAKPVDPRLFVDVMRGLAPAAAAAPAAASARGEARPVPVEETGPRAEEMYLSSLPHRLSAIVNSAQDGDPAGVAVAAEALATASDRLGHVEVAFLSSTVARDARRGMVAHARLVKLVDLCAQIDQRGRAFVTQSSRTA
jgi:DNA-binding response OmpR family regulator